MKRTFALLGVTLLLMLSCDYHSRHDKELLDKIEELWVMSDSSVEDAMIRTSMLEDEVSEASDMVNMKYALLNIRLRDKLYIVPSSDDSIKTVVAYFEKHGTISDMARAYYYMLCVYRDLHDSPRAIVNGIKALELARSMSEQDSLLLMHIYSSLSMIYHSQLNTEESIHMALEYLNLYPNDPWAAMDVASAYYDDKDKDNAIKYYIKAYDLMIKDTMMVTHPSNYCELLGMFSMYKDEQRAQTLYKRIGKLKESQRPSNYDIALGFFHKEHGNMDSALYYFKHRYENASTWVGKSDAASQMTECYYLKGDYAKAADYAIKFREANDSVIEERQYDLTRNAQAEYKYNRDREREAQIRLDALNMQRWLLIAIIVFMIVSASGYTYYRIKRRKLEESITKSNSHISLLHKELAEKETSIQSTKEELERSDEMLSAKQTELSTVMMTMAEKQRELIGMKESLGKRELELADLETRLAETDNRISKLQYELSGKSQMNKELIRELVGKELTELNTDVLEMFDRSVTGRVKLTERQWADFLAYIDYKHPNLKTILEDRVPRLNVALMQTAYLMMAGLTNQQIESVMGVSRQTQWERAKKLEKYIGDILPLRG